MTKTHEPVLTLIEVANQYPKKWLLLYAVDVIAQDEKGHFDCREIGQLIYEGGKFPIRGVNFGRLVTEFPPLLVGNS